MGQSLTLTNLPEEILMMIVKELYADTRIRRVRSMRGRYGHRRSFRAIMLVNRKLSQIAVELFPRFATAFIGYTVKEGLFRCVTWDCREDEEKFRRFEHLYTSADVGDILVKEIKNGWRLSFPRLRQLAVKVAGE